MTIRSERAIVGFCLFIILVAFTSSSSLTAGTTVYSQDFQGTVGPEWSSKTVSTTPVGARKFLGRFLNDPVTLTLKNLPSHTELTLSFDVFVILSWGGWWDPDIWEVSVAGGPVLLRTTFDNWGPTGQNYPDSYPGPDHPAQTGATEKQTLGYFYGYGYYPNGMMDAVYHLSFTFPHNGDSVTLVFRATGLEDEDWGLDNVCLLASAPASPPVVEAGPDASIDEGGTFTGKGSFSDPDSTSWKATVDYGDGSGTQALPLKPDKTFTLSHVYADNGTAPYKVTVTVTDNGGLPGSDSLNVTVRNVAPTARITAVRPPIPDFILPGDVITFEGSFTDPGTRDTHTCSWDFGDDATAPGTSAQHAYPAAWTYTVTFTVTDDDGGVGVATTAIHVSSPSEAAETLLQLVAGLGLPLGIESSLVSKLENAIARLSDGNSPAAVNILEAFIHDVGAQSGKKITRSQADTLIAMANRLVDQLGRPVVDTGFDVERDGFAFSNDLDHIPDESLWNFLDLESHACLGMSYFAQTYYVEAIRKLGVPLHLAEGDTGVLQYVPVPTLWIRALQDFVPLLLSATGWMPDNVAIRGTILNMQLTGYPIVVLMKPPADIQADGHAVLAYRVEEAADEIILFVYDPDFPGDPNRRIVYDKTTRRATYEYFTRFSWIPYVSWYAPY